MHIDSSASCTTTTASAQTSLPSFRVKHVTDDQIYPPLTLSVYLEGPPEDTRGFSRWLGRAACSRVYDVKLADLVIFTGGSDVNPQLYGEDRMPGTYIDEDRDAACIALYETCLKDGIPMLGICRGAQFLWVMKGGKLWQDVDKHNSGSHTATLLETNQTLTISSVHHQACRFGQVSGMKLLMSSSASQRREAVEVTQTGCMTDIEAFTFTDDAILGIQGHPEYDGFPVYSKLCVDLIDKHICMSTKTRMVGGLYRVVD